MQIPHLHTVEILDSRAHPTLAVTLTTADGSRFRAGVPSGTSTGSRKAVELPDGDKARYNGQDVRTAIGRVNSEIARALTGRTFASAEVIPRPARCEPPSGRSRVLSRVPSYAVGVAGSGA
ncbi:hypothetical protein ADL12_41350 [Streptomyces regalis]|uniref:Enolase N-terminal domain-containing protein n=1 Tax=Streptomyces regalis TaxID=68262 RepID=A0A101J9Q9_9ACTN|nr:hypothetical protein ADL12_41350 [Streptomyces regalis]